MRLVQAVWVLEALLVLLLKVIELDQKIYGALGLGILQRSIDLPLESLGYFLRIPESVFRNQMASRIDRLKEGIIIWKIT